MQRFRTSRKCCKAPPCYRTNLLPSIQIADAQSAAAALSHKVHHATGHGNLQNNEQQSHSRCRSSFVLSTCIWQMCGKRSRSQTSGRCDPLWPHLVAECCL